MSNTTKLTLLLILTFIALPGYAQTHAIVPVALQTTEGPITVHELRFYKIKTAHDLMWGLEELCGTPNQILEGRYQPKIKEYLWEAVQLPNKKTYALLATGTETKDEYFASVMIFDPRGQDALDPDHPDKAYLVDYFVTLMD